MKMITNAEWRQCTWEHLRGESSASTKKRGVFVGREYTDEGMIPFALPRFYNAENAVRIFKARPRIVSLLSRFPTGTEVEWSTVLPCQNHHGNGRKTTGKRKREEDAPLFDTLFVLSQIPFNFNVPHMPHLFVDSIVFLSWASTRLLVEHQFEWAQVRERVTWDLRDVLAIVTSPDQSASALVHLHLVAYRLADTSPLAIRLTRGCTGLLRVEVRRFFSASIRGFVETIEEAVRELPPTVVSWKINRYVITTTATAEETEAEPKTLVEGCRVLKLQRREHWSGSGDETTNSSFRLALEIYTNKSESTALAIHGTSRFIKTCMDWMHSARGGAYQVSLRLETTQEEMPRLGELLRGRRQRSNVILLDTLHRNLFPMSIVRLEVEANPAVLSSLDQASFLFSLLAQSFEEAVSTRHTTKPDTLPPRCIPEDILESLSSGSAHAYHTFVEALAAVGGLTATERNQLQSAAATMQDRRLQDWSSRPFASLLLHRLALNPATLPVLAIDNQRTTTVEERLFEAIDLIAWPRVGQRLVRPRDLKRPRDWSLADEAGGALFKTGPPAAVSVKTDGTECLMVLIAGHMGVFSFIEDVPNVILPYTTADEDADAAMLLIALAERIDATDVAFLIPHQPLWLGRAIPWNVAPTFDDCQELKITIRARSVRAETKIWHLMPKPWFRTSICPASLAQGLPSTPAIACIAVKRCHDLSERWNQIGVPNDGMIVLTGSDIVKWKPNPTVDVSLDVVTGDVFFKHQLQPAEDVFISTHRPAWLAGLSSSGRVVVECTVLADGRLLPLKQRESGKMPNQRATYDCISALVRSPGGVPNWSSLLSVQHRGWATLARWLIRSAILEAFSSICWPSGGTDFCVMGSGRGANHVLFHNSIPGTTVWNVDLSNLDMCRERAIQMETETRYRFVQMDANLFTPPAGAVLLYVLSLYQIGGRTASANHPTFVVTHEVNRIIQDATQGRHFHICGAGDGGGAQWSLGNQVHLAFDEVEGPKAGCICVCQTYQREQLIPYVWSGTGAMEQGIREVRATPPPPDARMPFQGSSLLYHLPMEWRVVLESLCIYHTHCV
jgi:hypothetical protein